MSNESRPLIERAARVLAGAHLSSNAEGSDPHAAGEVDDSWRDYRNQAAAVLHALRDPPPGLDEGQCADWRRLMEAALD